jgi:tetratricopeptide (TPR) repeat protein
MPSPLRSVALAAAALAVLLVCALPASAQMPIPDTFKNLKVLPKDIPKDQLVRVMRGFTTSLGVRCDFCHVEPAGPRGPGGPPPDFASDEKENKAKARVMLKMVHAINTDYLPQLEEGEAPPQITCETCHRGTKEPPEPLATRLAGTVTAKGVDAAFDAFADLKAKYSEAGLYDLRVQGLLRTAQTLAEEKHGDEGLRFLKKAKTVFPESAEVAASLGSALVQAGDVDGGKAELERAVSIDPNNGLARFFLERLKQTGPPPR